MEDGAGKNRFSLNSIIVAVATFLIAIGGIFSFVMGWVSFDSTVFDPAKPYFLSSEQMQTATPADRARCRSFRDAKSLHSAIALLRASQTNQHQIDEALAAMEAHEVFYDVLERAQPELRRHGRQVAACFITLALLAVSALWLMLLFGQSRAHFLEDLEKIGNKLMDRFAAHQSTVHAESEQQIATIGKTVETMKKSRKNGGKTP